MAIQVDFQMDLKLEKKNIDLETFALIAVAGIMVPFFIYYALWSFAISLICHLFWMGVKCGLGLMAVCSLIMALLKISKRKPEGATAAGARALGIDITAASGEVRDQVKCTMMDVVLTVLFQAGVRIHPGIWRGLMDNLVKGSEEGGAIEVKGLSKRTDESEDEETTTENDVAVIEDIGASGDQVQSFAEDKIWMEMLMDEKLPSIPLSFDENKRTRRHLKATRNRTKKIN